MITVVDNIPAPQYSNASLGQRRGRPTKYPWDSMKIGSSFFASGMSITSMCPAVNQRVKRHGGRYTCKSVPGGVHVWRVG